MGISPDVGDCSLKPTRQNSLVALIILSSVLVAGQEATPEQREYPFSAVAVQTALQQLGAYTGARLPLLSGFVRGEPEKTAHYEYPYYEYKIDLTEIAPDRTLVRAKANVSAWYRDPDGKNSGYQALESNGRLESDLLDRLREFLVGGKSKIANEQDLERQIAKVREQRDVAERHITQLQGQIAELQNLKNRVQGLRFASTATRVPVLSAPENSASVLLRTEPEDVFEILERRGAWWQAQLGSGRRGWIRSSQVKSDLAVFNSEEEKNPANQDFAVIRETISEFSGEWVRLKGKQVLYLWANAQGSTVAMSSAKKLRFAEQVFIERYREISHTSQSPVTGVVVIFLDQHGGVAAASLHDIQLWSEGGLNSKAFLKKCSFDPPGAFESAATLRAATGP
jgi:Bacterial SH3 domain